MKKRFSVDDVQMLMKTGEDKVGPVAKAKKITNNKVNFIKSNNVNIDQRKTTSHIGLQPGLTRATFIVREEYLEKIKTASFLERKSIREVLDEALSQFLKSKKVKAVR